jgi:hypothetical protein
MHSGAPFAKKGGSDLSLPKMDVPINLLQWEIFLPEQYKVKNFGGDAIAANLLPATSSDVSGAEENSVGVAGQYFVHNIEFVSLLRGQLGGIIVDTTGAVVPNAQVTVTHVDTGAVRNVVTDSVGRWIVSNLPSGSVRISANAPGFNRLVRDLNYDGSRPVPINLPLSLGSTNETITVIAEAGRNFTTLDLERLQRDAKKAAEKQQMAASSNVMNLQQRISGVLPVRIDVPRAGNAYHFVRPLVLDEETKVSFTYKSK